MHRKKIHQSSSRQLFFPRESFPLFTSLHFTSPHFPSPHLIIMSGILSQKQVNQLLRVKRLQFIEKVIGKGSFGEQSLKSAQARRHTALVQSGQPPKVSPFAKDQGHVVYVFNIKSFTGPSVLAARKAFHAEGLRLRQVPNGLVRSIAKDTPYVHMMTGPVLIATPAEEGRTFDIMESIQTAKKFMTNPAISKGLLLSGVVHGDTYMTPERVNYALANAGEREKIASLVMHPAMQIAQAIQTPQILSLATLFARNEKLKKEGAAATDAAPAPDAAPAAVAAAEEKKEETPAASS